MDKVVSSQIVILRSYPISISLILKRIGKMLRNRLCSCFIISCWMTFSQFSRTKKIRRLGSVDILFAENKRDDKFFQDITS